MSLKNMIQQTPILLVEDNDDDVLITRRALKKGQIKNKLFVTHDGEEALRFLKNENEFEDKPKPGLILLDLNMPKLDGFGVLEYVKRDENLKSIPVIILTTSKRDADIGRAYDLGCNSYIVKPVNFEKFIGTVVKIRDYWLVISKIP